MRGRIGLLCCATLLTGCSILAPRDPPPLPPAPAPLPNARQILLNSTDSLFDPSAHPKNTAISEVRHFETAAGPQYGVCLRVSLTNRQGKPLGNVAYVVIFDRNKIADRKRAEPADGCNKESYQPL
jgi:hypothetical protein